MDRFRGTPQLNTRILTKISSHCITLRCILLNKTVETDYFQGKETRTTINVQNEQKKSRNPAQISNAYRELTTLNAQQMIWEKYWRTPSKQ